MPQSKEDRSEYFRAYRVANKEKIVAKQKAYRLANKEKVAEYKKAYRVANKEKVSEYNKAYNRENHESKMIRHWRQHGHFIPEGTEHAAYVRFRDTTHCEFCGWELVTGGKPKTNTKVRHHDHNIEGEDNFIAVVCHICNIREQCTNKSGEPNVFYEKETGNWRFSIKYCGKKYQKGRFSSFEEAVAHKGEWFSLNSPRCFHDPSWICELP